MGPWSSLWKDRSCSVLEPCCYSPFFLIWLMIYLPTALLKAKEAKERVLLHHHHDEIAESQSEVERTAPPPPVDVHVQLSIIRTLIPSATGTFIHYGHTYSNIYSRAIYWAQIAITHVFHTPSLTSKPNHQLPRTSARGPTGVAPGPETSKGYGTVGQPSGAPKSKARASKTPVRKSLRQNDGDDDDDGENNGRHPTSPSDKPDTAQDPPDSKFFACPFYKLDPRRHFPCCSLQLRDVDRVIQHIKRNHLVHKLPCDSCWSTFSNDQALRDHTNNESCVPTRGPDDLFDEDLYLLKTGRGLSDEEKWFQIWDQVFKEHPRPPSPYRHGIDELAELVLNECWSRMHAWLPLIQAQFHHEVSPDHTASIVMAVMQAIFSQPLLSESRHRRDPRPPAIPGVTINGDFGDDHGRQANYPAIPFEPTDRPNVETLQVPELVDGEASTDLTHHPTDNLADQYFMDLVNWEEGNDFPPSAESQNDAGV